MSSKVCSFLLLVAAFFLHATFLEARHNPLYNITASDTSNFVWFRTAKVGTRTILSILDDNKIKYSINDDAVPYNPKRFKNHYKFAFVRNPWDRVVSCYCNKVVTKIHKPFQECFDKDFDYFVDFINRLDVAKVDKHLRLQTRLFPYRQADFIGRFERFTEDLQYVMKMIGLNNVVIPKINTSMHVHYSKYYTERTKQIIANKYKEDIKIFGYRFEEEEPPETGL